jgi:hypothetical protein
VGTRNSAGVWTPDQAKRWLDFTRAAGGRIAAAEWMNEPTLAAISGAPKGYDAAAFGLDFKIFHAFAKESAAHVGTDGGRVLCRLPPLGQTAHPR